MVRRVIVSCVLAAAGCHVGGGPVIAYSPGRGMRAGLEASGGWAFVHGSVGGTGTIIGSGPARTYATLDPGFPVASEATWRDLTFFGGGTIGVSPNDDGGTGLAAGAWTASLFGEPCSANQVTNPVSIALGVRWLAGVPEIYVTPKISVLQNCHIATH